MVLGEEPEMLENNFLEFPKTKYWVQNEKWFARNENEFWQWFWLGVRNVSKRPPGGLLERLLGKEPEMVQNGLLEFSWGVLGQEPEMLQNGLLEASSRDFWARSKKFLK